MPTPNAPVRAAAARRTETPNARMTTLASPTLGASAGLSLWLVEMDDGSSGPLHAFDSEQVWCVRAGALEIAVGGERYALGVGDTLVLPAHELRRVSARGAAQAVVCGYGDAIVSVSGEDAPRGTPPWIS